MLDSWGRQWLGLSGSLPLPRVEGNSSTVGPQRNLTDCSGRRALPLIACFSGHRLQTDQTSRDVSRRRGRLVRGASRRPPSQQAELTRVKRLVPSSLALFCLCAAMLVESLFPGTVVRALRVGS